MFTDIEAHGLVLLGCGRMGSAMLAGCLDAGLLARAVWVLEPQPSDWLKELGVHLNVGIPRNPAVALIAVKPQAMADALSALEPIGNGHSLAISVAAGTPVSTIEAALGPETPVIRAMPNTPAAVRRGTTAIFGNARVDDRGYDMAELLLSSIGQVVRLENESQMDAVTAVSGSGPAYVFHLVEALAAAGTAEGLPSDLAGKLARATVVGAGALMDGTTEAPERMRENVTSPGGTTAAALSVLMNNDTGLPALMRQAVSAATNRSRELGNG